jgi:hypothetical protein
MRWKDMDHSRCPIAAPWKIDERAEIILTGSDTKLLGSRRHFLVFGLYPAHAPFHPERNIGC